MTAIQEARMLSHIVYKEGQIRGQEAIAMIPLLKGRVLHGISLGPASKNMAEMFEPNQKVIDHRIETFLERLGMAPLDYAFLMVPSPIGQRRIVDIDSRLVHKALKRPFFKEDRESVLQADSLVTDIKGTPLMVKTADCPAIIIYGQKDDGLPLAALVHTGWRETNAEIPFKTIMHCMEAYGCDPADMLVGITPGISPEHYSISYKDREFFDRSIWEGHSWERASSTEARIHLDIRGAVIRQLLAAGVERQHLQAYGPAVDTYALAAQNPRLSFSHRFAQESNQPKRNGRMLIAVSL